MRTWLQVITTQVGKEAMGGQDEGRAGGLPWEPLHLESKGASKEPDNKKPEGQDFNKEAMASYKEEEQNI